jgi:Zn-dependent protease with chaperone function
MSTATQDQAVQGMGHVFDGRSSQRRSVHLLLIGDVLRVAMDVLPAHAENMDGTAVAAASPSLPQRHHVSTLTVSEPFDGVPLSVGLPDGSTVWIDENDRHLGLALFERHTKHRSGLSRPWVHRLIRSWPAVMACLLGTVVLLAWYDRQGASLVATAALQVMPHRVDEVVGDAAWATIHKQWLTASQVHPDRRLAIERRFQELASQVAPDQRLMLRFHRLKPKAATAADDGEEAELEAGEAPRAEPSPPTRPIRPDDGGFNAFALPNGTLVLLDGITDALTDDELMVVLGHEVGHVVHRHSMKQVVRSFSLLAVANVALGDFSSVLATSVSTLQTFRYSRDAEREADAYGRAWMAKAGLPRGTEAAVWRKFKAVMQAHGADEIPDWLSTHPSPDERLKTAHDF